MCLHKDDLAGRVLEAKEQRAGSGKSRDHLLDQTGAPQVIWMTEKELTSEMLTDLGKILGRVLRHKKQAGYAFRENGGAAADNANSTSAGILP